VSFGALGCVDGILGSFVYSYTASCQQPSSNPPQQPAMSSIPSVLGHAQIGAMAVPMVVVVARNSARQVIASRKGYLEVILLSICKPCLG
jgi:hypothetical protein